jgi:hypothetical protein
MKNFALPLVSACLVGAPALGQESTGVAFIANRGQWNCETQFLTRGLEIPARLEEDGLSLLLRENAEDDALIVRFAFESGKFAPGIDGYEPRAERYSYFLGRDVSRWRGGVDAYSSVVYRNVAPGVDFVLRESSETRAALEYDLRCRPGADPSQLILRCEGSTALSIAADGALVIETALGPLVQPPPRTFQTLPGSEIVPVQCRYRLLGPTRFGFEVGAVDPHLALTIDPVFHWLGFVGDFGNDEGWGMDVQAPTPEHPSGVIVIAGATDSVAEFPNFPPGEIFRGDVLGGLNTFVARIDQASHDPISITLLGGQADERAVNLDLDRDGSAVIVGYTASFDFPVTNDTAFAGGLPGTLENAATDGFIAKLSADGATLLYSTLLGGDCQDVITSVALESTGDAVVLGFSNSADFPTTPGAFQTEPGGQLDAIICRVHFTTGRALEEQLLYSSYLGGAGNEINSDPNNFGRYWRRALALESDGVAIVSSTTYSADFPRTPGAFDAGRTVDTTNSDTFITKLRLDARLAPEDQLAYSCTIGGAGGEGGNIAVRDDSGGVWLCGYTWSSDFPTTANAFQSSLGGDVDGYLLHLNLDRTVEPAENQLLYSSFFGGNDNDGPEAMILLADGSLLLGGFALSSDFPRRPAIADDPIAGPFGARDAIIAWIDPGRPPAEQLLYADYLGGTSFDAIYAIRSPEPGWIIAVGRTESPLFPQFDGPTSLGANEAFVVELEVQLPVAAFSVVGPDATGLFHLDATTSMTPAGTNLVKFHWDLGPDAEAEGAVVDYSLGDPGRAIVKLTVTNDAGFQSAKQASISRPCERDDVTPWTSVDVGAPIFTGGARWEEKGGARVLAICAGGEGIKLTKDSFHFAYQELEGDGTLTVRIAEIAGGASGAQMGLMMRTALEDAGAVQASLLFQSPTSLRPIYRLAPGKSITVGKSTPRSEWLQLERLGSTIIYRAGGLDSVPVWTELARQDFGTALSSVTTLYAGVAAAGRDPGADLPFTALRASFSNLELESSVSGPTFRRGDSDANGMIDLTDAIKLLNFLFTGGPVPECLDAADFDDSGIADISDAIANLSFQFLGGPEPAAPGAQACGVDAQIETPDLGCTVGCGLVRAVRNAP